MFSKNVSFLERGTYSDANLRILLKIQRIVLSINLLEY